MEPGDIIGWYASDVGAIGFRKQKSRRKPSWFKNVATMTGNDKPNIADNVTASVTVAKEYAVEICYGRHLFTYHAIMCCLSPEPRLSTKP